MNNMRKPTDLETINTMLTDFYKLCERHNKGCKYLDSGRATEAEAYRFNFEILTPINKYLMAFKEWGVEYDKHRGFALGAED